MMLAVLLCFSIPQMICRADTESVHSSAAMVVDPIKNKDSVSAVVYNNQNGLPTSEANAIAETRDGFIWIASYSGLVRYDGNTFERMDSTNGIANVGNLYVDKKDRLWVGTNDAGVAVMEKDTIRFWNEEDGLKSLNISEMAEDPNGVIYVSSAAGVYMFDQDLNMTPVEDPRITDLYVDVLRTGADGMIYGSSNNDDIFILRDGEVVNFFPKESYDVSGVTFVIPDPERAGRLYIAGDDQKLYAMEIGDTLTIAEEIDISPLSGIMEIKRIGRRLWISGRNGIGVYDGEVFHDLTYLPLNNSVGDMMSDYEGNIWFTSTRQGVMKLVRNHFVDIFNRYDIDSNVVNSTCMSEGNLFIGSDTGLIVLGEDGVLEELPLSEAHTASGEVLPDTDLIAMMDGVRIRSIIPDSKGRLWISTWRNKGLLCYDRGAVTVFNVEDGLLSDRIRAVTEAGDGSILAALTGGVSVIRNGEVVRSFGESEGILNPESLTVCAAPNGDILVGSDGSGIYVVNESGTRCISTRDGLSSGIVMRIKYDAKRHVFWIITGNSISYMTEDYEVTTVKNFPYSNNFDLYENSQEKMWILSSAGIYMLPADDLLANKEMNPVLYTMDNGLPCITTSNSYSALTEDGELYMAGSSGVALVNIDEPMESVIDLKASVPYIEADGVLVYPDENGEFTIGKFVRKITIYTYVFNYSLTNPMVSYRLDGFDAKDTTVIRSELKPVDYTNLRGGSYRFVIKIRDAQGNLGKRISIAINKEKKLYEQTWFYVLSVLGVVILLATAIWLYIRRMTAKMEKKHREEVQKERLNTELKTAGQIQESMLPHDFPPFPKKEEFDIYASMNPAREVGGDFYDYFLIDEDHLCMVIADVSGKGIPASLFMMMSKVILQSSAMSGKSAAQILTTANESLCANNQVEMFVTIWIGILEISTGKVQACNAGHEFPAVSHNGRFELMKDPHGFVVGGLEFVKYREYEFMMAPGDRLFVYTDGVPEATNSELKMFGTDRMIEALNMNPEGTPKEILEGMRNAVNDFVKDAEQFDDVTMLCMEYKGSSASETE